MSRIPFSNNNYYESGTRLVDGTNLAAIGTLNNTGSPTSPTRRQDPDGYLLRYESADPASSQYCGVRVDFSTPQDWSSYEKIAIALQIPEGELGDAYQ